MQKWQCRVSPTLGALEGTQNETWGTVDYTNINDSTVFMGCYGLPDFMAIRNHKGKKALFWCGTDILYLKNGYWLDNKGKIRVDPKPFCRYLNKYVDNWVENQSEYRELKKLGIESKVCHSFVGDINKFEVSFKPGNKVYTSVSGDDFERYGWYKIPKLAEKNPEIEFHLYGNNSYFGVDMPNVIIHGRVPKEQMNEEIKEMQGALRLIKMEGFSEIIAKSILMGQWPISAIDYRHMIKLKNIKQILDKKLPNKIGRQYYINKINKFPWNTNI